MGHLTLFVLLVLSRLVGTAPQFLEQIQRTAPQSVRTASSRGQNDVITPQTPLFVILVRQLRQDGLAQIHPLSILSALSVEMEL